MQKAVIASGRAAAVVIRRPDARRTATRAATWTATAQRVGGKPLQPRHPGWWKPFRANCMSRWMPHGPTGWPVRDTTTRAALVGAALVGAALVGAALVGAALVGAALVGAALVGAAATRGAVMPAGVTRDGRMRHRCSAYEWLAARATSAPGLGGGGRDKRGCVCHLLVIAVVKRWEVGLPSQLRMLVQPPRQRLPLGLDPPVERGEKP
jgi:hypothetical protein